MLCRRTTCDLQAVCSGLVISRECQKTGHRSSVFEHCRPAQCEGSVRTWRNLHSVWVDLVHKDLSNLPQCERALWTRTVSQCAITCTFNSLRVADQLGPDKRRLYTKILPNVQPWTRSVRGGRTVCVCVPGLCVCVCFYSVCM